MCSAYVVYAERLSFDSFRIVTCLSLIFFFFKQKTAYEMRISDWSSDVCSSDLGVQLGHQGLHERARGGERKHPAGVRQEQQGSQPPQQIGRASCRERVCQYV